MGADNSNSARFWDFLNDNAIWVFIAFIILVDAVVRVLTR